MTPSREICVYVEGIKVKTVWDSYRICNQNIPDKIFQKIINFLDTDLELLRITIQNALSNRPYPSLFNKENSRAIICNQLEKDHYQMRLSWRLVCKKWFLITSQGYEHLQTLTNASLKLRAHIASQNNTF